MTKSSLRVALVATLLLGAGALASRAFATTQGVSAGHSAAVNQANCVFFDTGSTPGLRNTCTSAVKWVMPLAWDVGGNKTVAISVRNNTQNQIACFAHTFNADGTTANVTGFSGATPSTGYGVKSVSISVANGQSTNIECTLPAQSGGTDSFTRLLFLNYL